MGFWRIYLRTDCAGVLTTALVGDEDHETLVLGKEVTFSLVLVFVDVKITSFCVNSKSIN